MFFNNNSNQSIYFKEKLPLQYEILPNKEIPSEIKRPNYVLDKNFDYNNKNYSIHNSEESINNHKASCKITAKVLQTIEDLNKSNPNYFNTTEDIHNSVFNEIVNTHKAYPTGVGYMGFPKSVCTSVNEIVVHGIPNTRLLKEGDSINVDVTNFINNCHGDSSIMIFKGNKINEEILRLSYITRNAMFKAIKYCKPNEKVNTIGKVIQEYIEKDNNYCVVKEFCGHGVGKDVHMDPLIYHFENSIDDLMKPGMTFTIEPVVCLKEYKELYILEDKWSIILPSYNPSAQWEHTILITNDGHEILTFRDKEVVPDIYKT